MTWYEYWRFVQHYLKFKKTDEAQINLSKGYFQNEFKKISGNKWFFTNEDAVTTAFKYLDASVKNNQNSQW